MKTIVCLDQNNGMYFNERRQSRDRYVIRDIMDMTKEDNLFVNDYSKDLFSTRDNLIISNDYFSKAKREDYCFIENHIPDQSSAEMLIVYRWDKVYPADYRLKLDQWRLVNTLEFAGYSHDKITKEICMA
jgi:hypothetical protein